MCYINHFLLIIFYHSVWLGFELFGLRAQVYSKLVQFTLVRKECDNHHCHYKPPERKWDWSVDDVMPGRDGPENLRILKKSQLRLNHGGWELSFCHWVIELDLGRWRWSWVACQHSLLSNNCVSLLVSRNRSQKLINRSYLERQSPLVFAYVYV